MTSFHIAWNLYLHPELYTIIIWLCSLLNIVYKTQRRQLKHLSQLLNYNIQNEITGGVKVMQWVSLPGFDPKLGLLSAWTYYA